MKPRNYLRSYLKSVRNSHRLYAHESSFSFKRKNVCITSRYCPQSTVMPASKSPLPPFIKGGNLMESLQNIPPFVKGDKGGFLCRLCPMLYALIPLLFPPPLSETKIEVRKPLPQTPIRHLTLWERLSAAMERTFWQNYLACGLIMTVPLSLESRPPLERMIRASSCR